MSASERKIAELEQKVRELQHLLSTQLRPNDTLWFESGVSARTRKAFVTIRWGDEAGQLDPPAAREHALGMLEAVNAAEFDEAFVRALTQPGGPGLEFEDAIGMLALVREARGTGTQASLVVKPSEPDA